MKTLEPLMNYSQLAIFFQAMVTATIIYSRVHRDFSILVHS